MDTNTAILAAVLSFTGVVIGSLISCFTSIIIELIKTKKENTKHLKSKKEEAYQQCCKIIYKASLIFSTDDDTSEDEIEQYIESLINMAVQMKIYAPKKIYDKLGEFISILRKQKKISSVLELEKEFIGLLRKDLGIKD